MTSYAPKSSKIELSGAAKTKGFSKLVIVKQCASRRRGDERARNLSMIGSFKEIGLDAGGMKLNFLLV